MLVRTIRYALLTAAVVVAALNSAAVAQTGTTELVEACKKTGIYLGPYRFQKLQDKPLNLNVETCLDGTAWTDLFNFNLRFDARVEKIQDTIDAFLNSKLNSCDGRKYAVNVTGVDVVSEPAVKSQQNINLTFNAVATHCTTPKFSAQVSVKVPLKLNIYTLRAIYDPPVVEVQPKGVLGRIVNYLPPLKNYVASLTVAQIEPYLNDYKDILANQKDKIDLFRPVVKKLEIHTDNDTVTAKMRMDARVSKSVVEEHSVVWINQLQLK